MLLVYAVIEAVLPAPAVDARTSRSCCQCNDVPLLLPDVLRTGLLLLLSATCPAVTRLTRLLLLLHPRSTSPTPWLSGLLLLLRQITRTLKEAL